MENKCCTKCGIPKPLDEFSNNKNKKDGKHIVCKLCFRDYYLTNKPEPKIKKELTEDEKISLINKQKEAKKLANKRYRENNKETLKITKRVYKQKRIETDPLFKLRTRISGNIISAFRRTKHVKSSKTEDILGCSFYEFKNHIESLWEPWMNWDNYGNPKDGVYELNKTWDIDHIIPNNLGSTEEEILKLNHYKNLKPLCSYYNRFIKKGDI